MPEYLAPGVYVEEVSSGNSPIAGVGTTTVGFVGVTERGALEPKFIANLTEFQQAYGGYLPQESDLAYAVEGFFTNGGQRCFVARVDRQAATLADYQRALQGLAAIDEIALVVVPDAVRVKGLTDAVIAHCETLQDRFAILAGEVGSTDSNNLHPPVDSNYGAFYHPWIKVVDPVTNGIITVPPVGHIAGIYARTDVERGLHKAPANEVIRGAVDLEFPVTKAMQDLLNPRGVNCLRDFRGDGRGIRVWGARTMSSDPEWKYINVRRLFLYLEESIEEGTQWVVFEPNDESTWSTVKRAVGNFLYTQWQDGALMGTTPDQAYFVACDRTTMTQDDIDNGRLVLVIGIAPVKPAEFVIFRVSQKTVEAA